MTDPSPKELLEQLSVQLGLRYESQDWGIQNADPDRLEEFLRFYETAPLAPTQRFEMGELVLASANDALVRGRVDPSRLRELKNFVTRNRANLQPHLAYWAALTPATEFPLAAVLNGLGL